jgi:hypothetical protein
LDKKAVTVTHLTGVGSNAGHNGYNVTLIKGREGKRLRVFNSKVFAPKRNEITGDWEKLHEVKAYK